MKVFVDTEFTDLLKPQLLSAGLVTESGEERYIEIDLQTRVGNELKKRATRFVHEHVLTQFGKRPQDIARQSQMGGRLVEWLLELAESSGERLEIVYDYAADAELLEASMRTTAGWRKLEPLVDWSIVDYLHEHADAEEAKAISLARTKAGDGLSDHHALADARALRDAFQAVHGQFRED